MYKFTEKDFEYFKNRCKYWKEFFKLHDWDMIVLLEDNLYEKGAQCRTNSSTHQAQIVLFQKNELVPENEVKDYLNNTALHEVAHILTADYDHIIAEEVNSDTRERICETFAIRMTNVFKDFKNV